MKQLGLQIDDHPVPPNHRYWIPCGCRQERATLRGGRYAYVTYARPPCARHVERIGSTHLGHLWVPADATPADVARSLTQHGIGERDHARD